MKIASTLLSAALALSLALASPLADAKRLGGGKSFGKQSPNVTQQQGGGGGAAPAGAGNTANSTAAPANSNAAAARPGTPAAAAAAPKKPWGAMLGGLAAGLGLAWLASSLGLGEAFGNILMFGLLALLVMVVAGFLIRKFRGGGNSANAVSGHGANKASPFAFQGAGNSAAGNNRDLQPSMPRSYSPDNVGNDASARPWERSNSSSGGMGTLAPAAGGSMIGSALLGGQSWGVPAGFDAEGFLKACKNNFITLQAAWDRSDIQSLRAMMTDDMLAQIKTQLAERESHTGGSVNITDVQMVEAQLLGIEELSDSYLASVEFSGMIREDASTSASPFREVWNLTKPRTGGGWLVAGVQALQ